MEGNILKDFETFEEFPNKFLLINKNSSYYYIRESNDSFIAKRVIKKICYDVDKIEIFLSYYNVLDGSLILNKKIIKKDNRVFKDNTDICIVNLSDVFSTKSNEQYYISFNDVISITKNNNFLVM